MTPAAVARSGGCPARHGTLWRRSRRDGQAVILRAGPSSVQRLRAPKSTVTIVTSRPWYAPGVRLSWIAATPRSRQPG
jgi:hypothetical protein